MAAIDPDLAHAGLLVEVASLLDDGEMREFAGFDRAELIGDAAEARGCRGQRGQGIAFAQAAGDGERDIRAGSGSFLPDHAW